MAHIDATTPAQIQQFLGKHGGVAVIDCHATWCGPCVRIAPYVQKKSKETGIAYIKVDVDQAPEVAQKYGIQAMPTFLVIQGKWDNVVKKTTGGSQDVVNQIFATALSSK